MNQHQRQENYDIAREEMKRYLGLPLTHEAVWSIHARIIGKTEMSSYRTQSGAPQVLNNGVISYWGPDAFSISMQTVMNAMLMWYNELPVVCSIQNAALLHWAIVKIHPFTDGNGRLARILLSHVLLSQSHNDADCIMLERRLKKIMKNIMMP